MNTNTFKLIFLIARPAAGKSEVIDYLKKAPLEERRNRFHINAFEEFDDFLYVWEMFEEDNILSKHGKPRVWTDDKYYFKDPFVWNLMIEKLNQAIKRRQAENSALLNGTTAIVEFSRGGEQAFAEAFSYFEKEILEQGAILYLDVSYEESLRKNRRRARKGQEHSILHHSLPDEKMEFYYKTNDWHQLIKQNPTHLTLKAQGNVSVKVPYVTLHNEPELTHDPKLLGEALEKSFNKLWEIRSAKL